MSAAAALRSIALREREAETFVVDAIGDTADRRLEDMRTRRAVQWQSDAVVNDKHREFVLRAREAKPDALFAGEQRSLRELVDYPCQLRARYGAVLLLPFIRVLFYHLLAQYILNILHRRSVGAVYRRF